MRESATNEKIHTCQNQGRRNGPEHGKPGFAYFRQMPDSQRRPDPDFKQAGPEKLQNTEPVTQSVLKPYLSPAQRFQRVETKTDGGPEPAPARHSTDQRWKEFAELTDLRSEDTVTKAMPIYKICISITESGHTPLLWRDIAAVQPQIRVTSDRKI